MIRIVKPGMLATVQDLGRYGHRHLGVAVCGSADAPAHRLANRVLGNPDSAAVIEFTLGRAIVEFTEETTFALSGADCHARLDDILLHPGWAYRASAGQTLLLGSPSNGLRSYVAFGGGIDVPRILGSRSTDLMAGFGGLQGRALKEGDVLSFEEPVGQVLADKGLLQPSYSKHIRLLAGPHAAQLPKQAIADLCRGAWRIGPASNRMGIRLEGEHHARLVHQLSLPSLGVKPGIVQLPPGGKPIILMNDCQTTGGYPVIATVIPADLHLLAQLRPSEPLTFEIVSHAQAENASRRFHEHLARQMLAINNYKNRN